MLKKLTRQKFWQWGKCCDFQGKIFRDIGCWRKCDWLGHERSWSTTAVRIHFEMDVGIRWCYIMFLGLRVLDIRRTNEVEDALAKQVIDRVVMILYKFLGFWLDWYMFSGSYSVHTRYATYHLVSFFLVFSVQLMLQCDFMLPVKRKPKRLPGARQSSQLLGFHYLCWTKLHFNWVLLTCCCPKPWPNLPDLLSAKLTWQWRNQNSLWGPLSPPPPFPSVSSPSFRFCQQNSIFSVSIHFSWEW